MTLGEEARQRYRIIVDDPPEVAREMQRGLDAVRRSRRRAGDAYNYNWSAADPAGVPEAVRADATPRWRRLELTMDQPVA